jgi:hypothetical protein
VCSSDLFVHQYASDEQLGEAALAALSIVGVGVLPVILLSLTIAKSRPGHGAGQIVDRIADRGA